MSALGVSIRKFGVLGIGEDETERIRTAARWAREKRRALLWPAGSYAISGTIAMEADAEYWRGEGAWLTSVRMLNPDLPAFAIAAKNNCKIEGFLLEGQGRETAGTGIKTDGGGGYNADSARILDVEARNFGTGIHGDGLANSQIRADLTANGIGYRQTGNSNANELGGSCTSNTIGIQIEQGTGLKINPMDIAGSETEAGLNLLGGYDISVTGTNCEVGRDNYAFAKVNGAQNVILNGCSVARVGGDWTNLVPVDAALGSFVTLNQCRFQGEAIQRNRIDTRLIRHEGNPLKVNVIEGGVSYGSYWANELYTRLASVSGLSAEEYAGQTLRCIYPGIADEERYCSRQLADGTFAWVSLLP